MGEAAPRCRHGRRVRYLLWAPLVLTLAACAGTAEGRNEPPPIAVCTVPEGPLAAAATLDSAAGSYHLTLVSAAPEGTQRSVVGVLQLRPNEPALRQLAGRAGDAAVSTPLYGWTDIDVTQVGALEIGAVSSQDPLRPGVLVLEQRPAPQAPVAITLRLGSLANRRAARPTFDGGYTALHVLRVEEESGGFAGTWVSGVRATRIEGHFCATAIVAEPDSR